MVEIILQQATESSTIPSEAELNLWISTALDAMKENHAGEITIRVVDEEESAELNESYRKKPYPTNVLSFPFEAPSGVPIAPHLGDLVLCAPVIDREAEDQGKSREAHWAHMIIHGVLHLLGLDHLDSIEAEKMEGREIEILAALGFSDPYA